MVDCRRGMDCLEFVRSCYEIWSDGILLVRAWIDGEGLVWVVRRGWGLGVYVYTALATVGGFSTLALAVATMMRGRSSCHSSTIFINILTLTVLFYSTVEQE